jgi:hypothetical protein
VRRRVQQAVLWLEAAHMRKAQYEYVEVIGMFNSMGGMMTVSK